LNYLFLIKIHFVGLKIYIPFLFLFCVVSKAQRNDHAFDVLDNKLIVPPNGIYVYDSLFLDDTEITNSYYLEYLHFLVQDSSSESLIKAYPDTTIFGKHHLEKLLKHKKEYYKKRNGKHMPVGTLIHDEAIRQPTHHHHWWNYFSYHGTRHFPLVGISYEQAMAYCKWRSAFITSYFNEGLKGQKKYKQFRDKKVEFLFSLPEERIWEAAAAAGLEPNNYVYGQKSIFSKDSVLIFNVKERKGKAEPQAIFDNPPNAFGFYNMIGNVSEMVLEKGKSKGGSYQDELEKCRINTSIGYAKPERWLGFRCVCIVKITPMNK
jgi:formylglycine-generating enzyme required for sulfatase activity